MKIFSKIRYLFAKLFYRQKPEVFNPLAFQGTKWFTVKPMKNGLFHVDSWIEIDRNKIGTVTVCRPVFWKRKDFISVTSIDKNLSELLTPEQVLKKIL